MFVNDYYSRLEVLIRAIYQRNTMNLNSQQDTNMMKIERPPELPQQLNNAQGLTN